MKYTIQWDDNSELWMMGGKAERFLEGHLLSIARDDGLSSVMAASESHLLTILKHRGIDIEVLEEDGSKVIW